MEWYTVQNTTDKKMNVKKLPALFVLLSLLSCGERDHFITVDGSRFMLEGKPYYFLGTNFWYGMNLGASDSTGDRARLIRELDRLKSLGIGNLRIMGGSEGPDDQPYRMLPSLQRAPGVYHEQVAAGLDFLLEEMRKRDMHAVVCLNNFWNWSGGMGQYIVWSGAADSIPHPPPHPGGSWSIYQEFAARFYSNEKAVALFNDHLHYIINRTNSLSGIAYREDPVIMAWELANEPRGISNTGDYKKWIDNTCALIRKLDTNHLVTLGSEGTTSSAYAGVNPLVDHQSKNVDYVTIHIWVQNWNIFDPEKPDSTLQASIDYAINYMRDHKEVALQLNKPLVLEEFGISRDGNSHDPASPTRVRDRYYAALFEHLFQEMKSDRSVFGGVNFWAWGGEGRPRVAEGLWKPGDDFIGDPPHEPQGWYSVYDHDSSTLKILREYSEKINFPGR
jgi:mannan endo-1,4-beta-mannosidase